MKLFGILILMIFSFASCVEEIPPEELAQETFSIPNEIPPKQPTPPSNNGDMTVLDGKALYNSSCTQCHHGSFENTTMKNKSAGEIQDAINNVQAMKVKAYLTALIPAQVSAIANSLKTAPLMKNRVSFSKSNSAIGEEKALAVVSIKLAEQAQANSSIEYYIKSGNASSGSDYEFIPGKLDFFKGEQEKSFTISIKNDQTQEPSESIVISLRNPVGLEIFGITEHTLTIIDDDVKTPTPISASFADFAGLLNTQKCFTCHDKPGYGNFSILTDLNNPISSEKAWINAKSNDGGSRYIVPGKPQESLILQRWRKIEDDGKVTGNMPSGNHTALLLSVEQRRLLESYITNLKVDTNQQPTVTSFPNFQLMNVGDASGARVVNNEAIETTVNSGDLTFNDDNFSYNYIRVYGNFDLSSKIEVTSNNHLWAKAGFMVRDKIESTAIRAAVNFLSNQKSVSIHNWQGASGFFEKVENFSTPFYLRVTRVSNKLTYFSKAGLYGAWKSFASFELPMDQLAYLGFAVSSWEKANTLKAKYSEIQFSGTLIGPTNLSDQDIKKALQNGIADFAKPYDYGEDLDISNIDPSQKFERFQAITQSYCMSCHNGADPVARDFSMYNTEDEWLRLKDLSGANLAIVKGSAKDSYLYKFLKHNQITGAPASMPKGSSTYKAEYTKYVADWINSFAIEDGSIAQDCSNVTRLPEPSTIRRLSHSEYNNSIKELFGLTGDYAQNIPKSSTYLGYEKVGGIGLLADKSYYNKVSEAAQNVINDLFSGKGKLSDKFNCTNSSTDSCHLDYLNRIAKHAFRKNLVNEHKTNLTQIFNTAKNLSLGKIEGTKAGLEYILNHPEFHLVIYLDGANQSVRSLSNVEILTQISLFLWSSLPDEADLSATISGSLNLQSATVLETFLDKVLNDVRATAFTKDFTNQWLEFEKLNDFNTPKYPAINTSMKASMKQESELLLNYILANDRPFTEILNANYSFVDEKLANHYGFNFSGNSSVMKYFYRPEDKRSGILSHASLLAVNSSGEDSKPTTRGKFVIDRIMCGELFDLPGGGVDPVALDPNQPFKLTVIEHSKDSSCAGCHQIMDPIGLGLENFDQGGVFRTQYGANKNNQTVDSKGALYVKEFNSVPELTNIIKEQNTFNKCLTEQLMVFGTGIKFNSKNRIQDKCEVEDIYQDTLNGKMSFKELIKKIVLSNSFRKRDLR